MKNLLEELRDMETILYYALERLEEFESLTNYDPCEYWYWRGLNLLTKIQRLV